jgi:hypothetical protein
VQNGRNARMDPQLTYSYNSLASILPQAISAQIFFVYTNVASAVDMNFNQQSVNAFFGFSQTHDIPFITIENPFAYVKRVQEELAKTTSSAEWTLKHLKALQNKLEASTKELESFFV